MDGRSLSRSAGAIALGYKEFDRDIDIAGIILNNIGSMNHYHYIKAAIERRTRIPVLGYLPKDPELRISERHLGLIPLEEKKLNLDFYKRVSKLVEDNIDLTALLEIGRQAKPLPHNKDTIFNQRRNAEQAFACYPRSGCRVTIAVAKDEAFNFYYQDNLDILSHFGADIVTFSPLRDRQLPNGIDGLYIGGGFPEVFASGLSKNKGIRRSIYQKAEEGLPVYAECGGLIYLAEALIDFKKRKFPMAGVFKGTVKMADRRQALGYVNIRVTRDNILSMRGDRNRAHVFHWSYLADSPKNPAFAYEIIKDKDNMIRDGLVKKNILAGYAQLHFASNVKFAKNFINSCRKYRR